MASTLLILVVLILVMGSWIALAIYVHDFEKKLKVFLEQVLQRFPRKPDPKKEE